MELAILFVLSLASGAIASSQPASTNTTTTSALRLSVYATAGDILHHLATPEGRERVVARLAPLHVSRLFLEGRRGDEYVPPAVLAEVRDDLLARGIECTGGIATVPGSQFGTRQTGALGWLNWESPRTQHDVSAFFRENAAVFQELIVDDFYCTADESPESITARGTRPWERYRQDLLTGLIPQLILNPTRAVRPDARLILKFPQWYDRFHLFGYDPQRMSQAFDAIWVGTEVRNPSTRRMGFVQPTEGSINFRWIRSIAGEKVIGAWFDHIECTAQNFLDQAFQSVLAGARELTLFRLGDLMEGHPGDALLATRLPELQQLASLVATHPPRGIPFYKPPGSDPADNLYLMDYLAMAGWPILPTATFPHSARSLFLGAQAAADPDILRQLDAALERGAMVTVTPAFVRRAGLAVARRAGVSVSPTAVAATTTNMTQRGRATSLALAVPLDVDATLKTTTARTLLSTQAQQERIPLLTQRRASDGTLQVLNVRTFSEEDFQAAGEWLLAPRDLGWSRIPATVADAWRRQALKPLNARFLAPGGVALQLFEGAACLSNFRSEAVAVELNRRSLRLEAHECRWLSSP